MVFIHWDWGCFCFCFWIAHFIGDVLGEGGLIVVIFQSVFISAISFIFCVLLSCDPNIYRSRNQFEINYGHGNVIYVVVAWSGISCQWHGNHLANCVKYWPSSEQLINCNQMRDRQVSIVSVTFSLSGWTEILLISRAMADIKWLVSACMIKSWLKSMLTPPN